MKGRTRRRWKRAAVKWLSTLLIEGRRESCTIVEISKSGAKLKVGHAITPGEQIVLFGERFGSLDATVVWSRGEFAGARFLDPQHMVELKLRPLLLELDRQDPGPELPAPRVTFGRRRDGKPKG